jgi:predicted transcriptional regulator
VNNKTRVQEEQEKDIMKGQKNLSRRERQIMDIIYEMSEATAAQVLERLPNPPSYSAVRALLRVLEEKGHLLHKQDGPRYVFLPTLPREQARRNALRHVLDTFFDGSTEEVVAALLNLSEEEMSQEDYKRLSELIESARIEGR